MCQEAMEALDIMCDSSYDVASDIKGVYIYTQNIGLLYGRNDKGE